jgi:iron complex outermembrane receptor protein
MLAGRSSGILHATVGNTGINPATYQGFESFLIAAARIHHQFDNYWSGAVG